MNYIAYEFCLKNMLKSKLQEYLKKLKYSLNVQSDREA